MRAAIVSASVPFQEDGAVALGEGLEAALRAAGHEAELILLPFSEAADAQLVQCVAYRTMAFAPQYDLVVTLRSPAEMVRHPRKVAWVASIPDPPGGGAMLADWALADACARASLAGLREARRVLAGSEEIARHLRAMGAEAVVVAPGDWDAAVCEALA